MIRLTQADAAGSDEGALFVNPDDISAVWIDLASPNHHAIVLLDTGTEFHVKDDIAVIVAAIEGKQRTAAPRQRITRQAPIFAHGAGRRGTGETK
ncbi:MAG TPA: hypothetical protein VFB23_11395 [Candidatus Acidoferrales bacterium]|nr:hypothetical protein [Candidatus Acidoferrales bacterium]